MRPYFTHALRELVTADFELRSSAQANLAAIERLGHELHRREYSHVLVATEDPGGYRLAGTVGAPTRIGFTDFWVNRSRRSGRADFSPGASIAALLSIRAACMNATFFSALPHR